MEPYEAGLLKFLTVSKKIYFMLWLNTHMYSHLYWNKYFKKQYLSLLHVIQKAIL